MGSSPAKRATSPDNIGISVNTMWFVYLLKCSDGSLYTGITTDIDRRVEEHNGGKSIFTRGRVPVALIYSEKSTGRSSATKREKEIKGWRREKKLELIK